MTLPYSRATSGDKAIAEVQKMLKTFGCDKFGVMQDYAAGTMIVQFEWKGHQVTFPASINGYAAMWLKENPWNRNRKSTREEWQARALEIGGFAVCSILRDWIKAQVMAVETGLVTFEEVFLAHIHTGSGQRFIEFAKSHTLIEDKA